MMDKPDRLHSFMQNSLEMVLVHSQGKILHANSRYLKESGYTLNEVLQLSVVDLVSEQYRKQVTAALARRIKGDTLPRFYELELLTKDGDVIPVGVSATPIIENGKVIETILVTRDTIKRKLAEQNQLESEKRFRMLADTAMDIIIVHDSDGNIIFYNQAFLNATGYDRKDIEGSNVKTFLPKDHLEAMVDRSRRRKAGDASKYRYELEYMDKNGKRVPIEVSSSASYEGDDLLYVLIIARDISERKQAQHMLEESEKKYRFIAENADVLITILTSDQELEYFNEKTHEKLLGIGKEELQDPSSRMDWVHPDDKEMVMKSLTQGFKQGSGSVEFRIKEKKDCDFRWFHTTGHVYEGKDGKRRLLTISRDITERKQLEEFIKKENIDLKSLVETRKSFVANATHELKTPLATVHGASKFLKENFSLLDKSQLESFINIMHRGANRLNQLVDDLLDYSLIENAKFVLHVHEKDLVQIAMECINDHQFLLEKRHHQLVTIFPGSMMVRVDPVRMEQVFTNLLSNAIKYTPPGGHIALTLTHDDSNDMVNFSIEDDGIGFLPRERESLFQEFGKIDRSGTAADVNIQGSGLGLFIAREIILAHGGKMWMESGGRFKGSTFFFSIPSSGPGGMSDMGEMGEKSEGCDD
ncbi:PAS domain S-box protein [Candidatus Bathyarchaeota archaeon]|nr:PAS domain S-box protein [Candidatus Bathyarchaeota archaeon]